MSEVHESQSILQLMELTEKKAREAEQSRIIEERRLEVEAKQLHTLERVEKKIDILISTNQNIAQILPMIARGDGDQVASVLREQQRDLLSALTTIGKTDVNVSSSSSTHNIGDVDGDVVGQSKNVT